MGLLIGLAAKVVGDRLAPFLAYGLILVAMIGAAWWLRADAYSDGVAATDAKWERASAEAKARAEASAQRADDASGARVADELDRVREEKERLDEAEARGDSPFDVLFGA